MSDWESLELWAANIAAPLRQEALSYAQAMNFDHARRFITCGLNPSLSRAKNVLGIAQVELLDGDFWQSIENGSTMATVAAFDGDAVTEIVAFDPAKPSVWYLRTGDCSILGADAIERARGDWEAAPLRVFATPFDWLIGGMNGCCVINWDDEARTTLRDMPALEVASPRYAQALRLELTRPPRIPEIQCMGGRRRAA